MRVDVKPVTPALPWTAALATGLEAVDRQHQRLLDIFNEAVASHSASGTSEQRADVLLASLVDYTNYHFREEAQLMRRWAVDPAHQNVHRREHAQFIRFLDQTRGMVDRYPQDAVRDALTVLTQWLVFHIMLMDKQMANEVRRRQWQATVRSEAAAVDRGNSQQQPDASFSQLSEALSWYTFENLDQKRQLLDLQSLYRALLHSAELLIHRRSEAEMLQGLCDTLVSDASFHAVWIGQPGAALAFDVLALAGNGAQQVHDDVPHLGDGPEVSVVVQAWKTERVVVCNDTLGDESLRPWHEGFHRHQWMALLAVPVFRGGTIWATLALISHVAGVFDRDTVALCTSAAELLGRGLDELDLRQRLVEQESQEAHQARHDALTGLPNRLALLQELPQAIARAQRHGTQLAVGMIDLDDFKPVNDTFGHATGDEVLRQLAGRMQSLLRVPDLVVRLGGDEFVIMLEDLDPATVMSQLHAALDRLHTAVDTPFDLGNGRSASLRMSLGVALFPHDGHEANTLLRRADAAMYATKAGKAERERWWALSAGAPDV
ncbi:MAG: diguanylate cyclase domain-containing protein [Acidimicrobiales bacterium]